MSNKITLELLQELCKSTKLEILEQYVDPLNAVCEKYEINTKNRKAAFLAQLIHESGGFNFTVENLNYSAKALNAVFKKYFPTEALALEYERKPEKIANRVYADRMGNGDENSGDGWKHRGRGLIQLTGKHNYGKFAESINKTIDEVIPYIETPQGAVESAAWFWNTNKLNKYCDDNDFVGLTKRINGGTNGLEDRQKYYDKATDLLKDRK